MRDPKFELQERIAARLAEEERNRITYEFQRAELDAEYAARLKSIDEARKQYRGRERRAELAMALMAGAFALLVALAYLGRWLISLAMLAGPFLPMPLLFAGVISVGLLLYLARCRTRLAYAITECIIGGGMALYGVQELSRADDELAVSLKIIGGLYVVVRGTDNFGKWLRDTKATDRQWRHSLQRHWVFIFGADYSK